MMIELMYSLSNNRLVSAVSNHRRQEACVTVFSPVAGGAIVSPASKEEGDSPCSVNFSFKIMGRLFLTCLSQVSKRSSTQQFNLPLFIIVLKYRKGAVGGGGRGRRKSRVVHHVDECISLSH